MITVRRAVLILTLLVPAVSLGCASSGTTSGSENAGRSDLLTREQILGAEATNIYDVIRRLRPRWLQVRSTRSFEMQTEIAVIENDVYLGPAEILKEMAPELAYELRYLDGIRAAAAIPGLMSGRHIEGAILVNTRGRGE